MFEVMFQLNTSEASSGISMFVEEKLSMGVSALVFFLLPLIAMACFFFFLCLHGLNNKFM